MSKREAKRNVPPGKQADTPPQEKEGVRQETGLGEHAQRLIKICDELLRLGRDEGSGSRLAVTPRHLKKQARRAKGKGEHVPAVGSVAPITGPSGMLGRTGIALDDVWEALAQQFDALGREAAELVQALDPTRPIDFYTPGPAVPLCDLYPNTEWREPPSVRDDFRDAMRAAYPAWSREQLEDHLERVDLVRMHARVQFSKRQWPGFVMEHGEHRSFVSPPESVEAFDRRFKALKGWAEGRLAEEQALALHQSAGMLADDFQPTSCLTSLQVIGSGQVHDGWEALRAILAVATRKVDIEDAHIDADVVALLRSVPDWVAVRVLSRKLYEDADPAFRRLAQQRSGKLEVRTTANLHGRRIYVDDRAYILEDSIKELACKTASSIVPVDKPTETRRLMEDFERRWATAGVNIRPKA